MSTFRGTGHDDTITGTSGNDNFLLFQGGSDTVNGGGGDDVFHMGAALNAGDRLDGGTGKDFIILNGDYSAGVVFNADTITNIEVMGLDAGHSYNLTLNDGNVAAGERLLVKAGGLGAANSLIFDGSAETDGKFYIIAGAGNDTLTGGARHDVFDLTHGGNDTAQGGDGQDLFIVDGAVNGADTLDGGSGHDSFYLGANLDASDHIDGGAGDDYLQIIGDYGASGSPMLLTSALLTSVDDLNIVGDHSYYFTADDSLVAAGATMVIDAGGIGAGVAVFDGSAEHDGAYHFIGGGTSSTFKGGDGNDEFDMFLTATSSSDGGAGNDLFVFADVFTSDMAVQGGTGSDTLEIDANVSGLVIDASHVEGIETLLLPDDHEFDNLSIVGDLTSPDGVTAGGTLTVDAGAAFKVSLDLSAATSSLYDITGSNGDDTITFGTNYHTAVNNGGPHDVIDAGAGFDTVVFNGHYADMALLHANLLGVEELIFEGAANHTQVEVDNALVAVGDSLIVDTTATTGGVFWTDNIATAQGSYHFISKSGLDILAGGAGNDTFDLTQVTSGFTRVTGNAGNDTFAFADNYVQSEFFIQGNAGTDTLSFDGDYASLALSHTGPLGPLNTIDALTFGGGHSYAGVSVAGNIVSTTAFAGTLTIDASGASDFAIDLSNAGNANDLITGSDGNDSVTFADNYSGADTFNGGDGTDTLVIESVQGGMVANFASNTIQNVETIVLDGLNPDSNFFELDLVDGNVAAGQTLTIYANSLGATAAVDIVTFDGSAELDGSFVFEGGAGTYTIKGGQQDDLIQFGGGYDSGNVLDGGGGSDTLELNGDYGPGTPGLNLGGVTNVEIIKLDAGHSYFLATTDATVASGQTLTADGSALGASDLMSFNASADTDGNFVMIGGAANDGFTSGGLNDNFTGGLGADTIVCGSAVDTIVTTAVAESTGASGYDTIQNFNFDADQFNLAGAHGVSAFSATTAAVSAATFDADILAASTGHMAGDGALSVTATLGDLAGHTFLVVDVNNDGVYVAGTDYVFDITGFTGTADTGDFI